jgi:type I restriction enzyme R subunit
MAGKDTMRWVNAKFSKALRKTLLKYQLHKDNELFEKAYNYIRQYY